MSDRSIYSTIVAVAQTCLQNSCQVLLFFHSLLKIVTPMEQNLLISGIYYYDIKSVNYKKNGPAIYC